MFWAIYLEFAKLSERSFEVGRLPCRCPRSTFHKFLTYASIWIIILRKKHKKISFRASRR